MASAHSIDVLTFPLNGTRLIEASAGTGKTYTIAALYVRLILGHGLSMPPLLPPDILVVTFTDAATKELRERIRVRLRQAAEFFRESTLAYDDFLRRLRDEYARDTWPSCAFKLEMAANWMDEAAVYTIHSWCNRMLQQHAFESGCLFKQEVDNDDQELLNQVVRDYWRQFFYPLSNTACKAVYRLAATPDHLASLLKPLLFETEASGLECDHENIFAVFSTWENWENRRNDLETQAREYWRNNQQAIEKQLTDSSEKGFLNGNQYRKTSFANRLKELAGWAVGASLEADMLAKYGQRKLQAGLTKSHQDKTHLVSHSAFQAIDILVEHRAQEIDIADLITRHALQWIRKRYDNEKQRMARMTFDDMLNRLDRSLGSNNGEQLAAAIIKQYPIAMIDEFQDTDPVQYRIFAGLYATTSAQNLGCFMIGDPKQAIYSFRGGDIYTYLKAHSATLGNHYSLDTNFRSTAALVQAVNHLFLQAEIQQLEGAFCFKQQTQNPLPFLPVAAQGRTEAWIDGNTLAPALTLWQISSDVPIGIPAYRQQMANSTASEIVRLLQTADKGHTGFQTHNGDIRPLQPADIAILVRSATEATVMRQALAARQIRSVYLSERESIYNSHEAADLLIWLRALADPRDERKVRAALSTATIGWSYQTLRQLTYDEALWERQLERFINYRQRWQQDGILPTLRQLLSDFSLPARLHALPDGERRLTNVLHLAELLQKASAQLEGEHALIRHLAETIAAGQAAEENIMRLESDANLIKIITIHKSKGLEYPLVFLPFICSFRDVNARNNAYYRYHDQDLDLRIDLGKSDSVKTLSDKERLQEDLRLLYVAVTRARFACWLGIAPIKVGSNKTCQLDKSAIGYLLGWQNGMAASELGSRLSQIKSDCTAINIAALPAATSELYNPKQADSHLEIPRSAATEIGAHWWIASYSAIATHASESTAKEAENFRDDKHGDETDLSPVPSLARVSGLHSLPRGAGPGVLVHELLEQCAQIGFATVHANPEIGRELIDKIFTSSAWNDKHECLWSSLQTWLSLPLFENNRFNLSQLPDQHYQAEMEFLLGAESVDTVSIDQLICQNVYPGQARPHLLANQINGLLKGFIDLVFEYEGRFYVLDYKFNALGHNDDAYTPNNLVLAMLSKRYDLQAVLYILALHRLLKTRLGEDYNYDQHVGGSIYLFLRGGGRICHRPPQTLITTLDSLFCRSSIAGVA